MERIAFIWKEALAEMAVHQSHLERTWKETPEHQDIDYKLILDDGQSDSISREYAEYREKEDLFLKKALAN